jgi:enterochelin esterase-like enzyme
MEPDSIFLVILLLAAAGGLVFAAVRVRWLAVKIATAALALAFAAVSGIAMVNDYYGYYQTWSQLASDFSGSYPSFDATNASADRRAVASGHGRMEQVRLPGAASGISRSGFVYLPPQYFEAKYAHVRFPVLELLHGSPGTPANWIVQINLAGIMDRLVAHDLAGPMIVVMPAIDSGSRFEDCVDAPGAKDDTYVTQDVRHDVLAHFRAASDPAEWGIAGYSSGGYCAANLALRHRASFGAAAIMDGYFRPADGPAAAALHDDPSAEAQNDPLAAAGRLPRGAGPLPALWVSGDTGSSKYAKGAQAFVRALHGVEAVTFVRQPGAGHNFYAWRAVIPHALAWLWTAVAPPDLRVRFPVAGPVDNSQVVPPLRGAAPSAPAKHPRSAATRSAGARSAAARNSHAAGRGAR